MQFTLFVRIPYVVGWQSTPSESTVFADRSDIRRMWTALKDMVVYAIAGTVLGNRVELIVEEAYRLPAHRLMCLMSRWDAARWF